MLTPDVLEYLERSVLCWLATADGEGRPNVSPKEVFAAIDTSHVLIANIASPRSVRNLRQDPEVCVSFVDVFVQKGNKLDGRATLVSRKNSRYARLVEVRRPPTMLREPTYRTRAGCWRACRHTWRPRGFEHGSSRLGATGGRPTAAYR